MRILLSIWALLIGCGGPDKPIVQANPEFATCSARKDMSENECLLLDGGGRAAFDACVAAKREKLKTCVDGGT